jgi:hypothetical protein
MKVLEKPTHGWKNSGILSRSMHGFTTRNKRGESFIINTINFSSF